MKWKTVCCLFVAALLTLVPVCVTAEETTEPDVSEAPAAVQEPSYSVAYPQNLPVPYGQTEFELDCPTIASSEGFSEGGIQISVSYTGFFEQLGADTKIPYQLIAVLDSGAEQSLNSGAVLTFSAQTDGTLTYYGGLPEGTVVKLIVRFADGAWDNLEPGEYATDIVFAETLTGQSEDSEI